MKSAFFLLPGALFAAVVIITLTLNTTVLQAIPARLTPSGYTLEDYLAEMNAAAMEDDGAAAAETQKKAPEFGERKSNAKEPKPSAAGIGDYEDGVYIGSSSGYGGPIEVRVTVRGRQITDVEILSASGETEEFFNRAMGVVACVLTAQTWDVDTVSGATFSSNGLLDAVDDALQKAVRS